MTTMVSLLLVLASGAAHGAASPQATLDAAALRFSQAWDRGDMGGLEEMLREDGIRLSVLGEEHTSVPPRQARATLEDFFGRFPGGKAELIRSRPLQKDARQGFAELRLTARPRGGGEAVIFTVFVGLALERGSWQVTELRILS